MGTALSHSLSWQLWLVAVARLHEEMAFCSGWARFRSAVDLSHRHYSAKGEVQAVLWWQRGCSLVDTWDTVARCWEHPAPTAPGGIRLWRKCIEMGGGCWSSLAFPTGVLPIPAQLQGRSGALGQTTECRMVYHTSGIWFFLFFLIFFGFSCDSFSLLLRFNNVPQLSFVCAEW